VPLFLWCRQDQFCFDREVAKGQKYHRETHNYHQWSSMRILQHSIKATMNSSHIPDDHGIGSAVDIACTNSKDRYELVELAQKLFKRIGISGGSYGGFVHLDVDRSKVQEVLWTY